MKISPFKISLVLVIIGIIWVSLVFNETAKVHDSILLKQSNSIEVKSEFSGVDIGYYKLYMPEFTGEEVFVQVLDTGDNVIDEQKVQTKMSVGYFDFSENGIYTIKITNISKNQIDLQIEFGNTNSQKMIPAGVTILVGSLGMMVVSYMKIKNYNIEQPEENIS
ncbi:MAG: hypothetical protein OEM28_05950 [Nitrosopumilus sp.]|nr:hypothetical protein [Nitrosopumilus sp.]MDH3487484.1 hypothetical protein [Nitrosopumilus sp.]